MTPKQAALLRVVSEHLNEIEREVFKPEAGMKLTFIARHPDNPEFDVLVSEDDLEEVGALVVRSRSRDVLQ